MADRHAHADEQHGKKIKKNPVLTALMRLASAAFVVYCFASIVSVQASIAEKRAELELLNEKAALLEAENDECMRLLNLMEGEDQGEYMERIAIEKCGYAFPGERRFYDNSRN